MSLPLHWLNMSKIYGLTAINRLTCAGWRSLPPAIRQRLPGWLFVCLLAPFLLSCASMRPVVKIGLIAPFEGLYRRTGYDALSAMRSAIKDTTITGKIDLLPLALDDSNDPQRTARTAEKLLRDPYVRAVIGPLTPMTVARVGERLGQASVLWFAPGALTSTGFIPPAAQPTALSELLHVIAPVMQRQGAQRIVLAGWPEQTSLQLADGVGLPSALLTELAAVRAEDAVFWLGDAAAGALFLTRLRQVQPQVPFWLGLQGEDPVFGAFTTLRERVYWASWADSGYDQWAQTHTPATLLAYQVYVATQQAIAQLHDPTVEIQGNWSLRLFALQPDGSSHPLRVE
jgi:Periplasmic binding protein